MPDSDSRSYTYITPEGWSSHQAQRTWDLAWLRWYPRGTMAMPFEQHRLIEADYLELQAISRIRN